MARNMKDSGIEWIGEIPEGWEISKVSYFYEVQLGKMLQPQKKSETDTEEKYLCAANVGKNSLSLDTLKTMWFSQTEKHQFDLKEGDLLVVEGGDVASCAIIETPVRNLFFQNALHRVRPLHNESVAFLRYWLMTAKSYGYIDFICNKATIAHFSKEKFIALPIPVIPQDIQSKIVSFLDLECKQIDDLLSKSRSSIEEYKKLKQAVITQAVTKGVRGEREMKDSGNQWFGQIPTDWKLSRVGLHFSIILGKMLCNAPLNDTYTLEPYYCAADVHFDGVADGERKKMWFSPIEKDLYRVSVGDLLVVEGGAGAGGSAIVEKQDSYTYIQNSIMIIRSKGNTDNRYLRYLLEFLVKQGYIDIVCNKATIPHFTKDKLSCVPFCLCPAGEQKEIADYLDAKCAEIDGLTAKKEQLVKELESYKKSLIYEVVTGKREV